MSWHLVRMSLRHLWRRPLQSALLVLGVALGVAVVIAIDLANVSARRAFSLSTESVTGKATQQIVSGPGGLDDALYTRLRVDLGLTKAAPIVEGYVAGGREPAQGAGLSLHLLGVDPFAEAPFRNYLVGNQEVPIGELVRFLVQPGTVIMSRGMAQQYGLALGDPLQIRVAGGTKTVILVALLDPSDDLSRQALDGLMLSDVATAQEILGKLGKLDRIDLIIPDSATGQEQLARISAILPGGARLETPATRSSAISQMTDAFTLNLTALSLLALVIGMFLIYNTVTFSVVQRRQIIGTLRCLGVTQGQIFAMIILEAAGLSALGSLIGVGLGIFLGQGTVALVTRTINDLYFVINVRQLAIEPFTLLKGAILGIGAALLAAVPPALEATLVSPVGALRRSNLEEGTLRRLPWVTLGGVLLSGAGAALLLFSGRALLPGFVGIFAVILGFAAFTPALTVWLMRLATPGLGRIAGVLGRMASRDVINSLSRTAVAVAALMVAVSVTIGVSIMVSSFRLTVEHWLDYTLRADVYISTPGGTSTPDNSGLDTTLAMQIAEVPGVRTVDTYRSVVAGSTVGPVNLTAIESKVPRSSQVYAYAVAGSEESWQKVREGGVLVSESFAYRHSIPYRPGANLTLYTDQGAHTFPIIGVVYDYGSDQGVVLMGLGVYRQYYQDPGVTSLAVYRQEGQDLTALVQNLRQHLAGQQLQIQPNAVLRQQALRVFDRTFAITSALRLLAILVAFIGVLSALLSLQLERSRELGVLRAIGLTVGQMWRLILLETGLMGLVAGLLAVPTGLTLATILVYIINRRSFGWSIQLQAAPEFFVQAVAIAVIAAVIAGIYPSLRLGKMAPALALRQE
ncbi:MAG: FtsX-like permease family protein [Chloroflexi bacterium]|nr:FtsX-like permease family protein [Chloroflexota bacterium]